MNWSAFQSGFVGIATIVVGCYPYLHKPNRLTKLFAISNFCLALLNLVDLVGYVPISHHARVMCDRLVYIFGIFMILSFFRFIMEFGAVPPQKYERLYRWMRVIGAGFILFTPTPFIIRDLQESDRLIREVPGFGMPAYIIFLLGSIGFAFFHLARQFPASSGRTKNQIRYMVLAIAFPLLEAAQYYGGLYIGRLNVQYFYLQIIYVSIVAYAIIAQQLLDIRVVIRRTLIYSGITAALSAVYLCLFAFGSHVVERGLGSHSILYSAAAAALVAVLFHPVQLRIQRWIDRRFPEESVDPLLLRRAAGSLAHEVKRPLASISLPAQLALQDLANVNVESWEAKRWIASAMQRLQGIVEELQSTGAKVEAVRELLSLQGSLGASVDLVEILRRCVQTHQEQAAALGQQIAFHPDVESFIIKGNVSQLEVVFGNLLKNAIDAMKESGSFGTVMVSVHQKDSEGDVKIADQGLGMSPETLSHIFEPWFTTKGNRGMGIGLYLVQQIVSRHHGTMEVRSVLGRGSTFLLSFPASL